MSRDIRSFFSTISKKQATKPPPSLNNSNSNSDIIPDTPDEKPKKPSIKNKITSTKRKRIVTPDSDSESEKDIKPAKTPKKEPVKPPKNEQIGRKYLTALEAFGNTPVNQSPPVKKIINEQINDDDDFDKSILELDETELLQQVETKTPTRKRKHSGSNEDAAAGSANTDEERYERKRHSAMLYQKYLNRSGPVHLGAKWTPKGKPDCLKGLCFIITGVLESLQREDAEALIKEHGGRCTSSVSGKVNYMVIGDDAGPAKVEKAKKFGTKMISEDDLIDLICVKSGITNQNIQTDSSTSTSTSKDEKIKSPKKEDKEVKPKEKDVTSKDSKDVKSKEIKKEKPKEEKEVKLKEDKEVKPKESKKEKSKEEKELKPKEEKEVKPKEKDVKSEVVTKPSKTTVKESKEVKPKVEKKPPKKVEESLQWVDKHKPKSLNEIIGQQGERSNVKKLQKWLENWQKNRLRESSGKGIPRPSPWAKDDDGAYFRCALLSGPPGVGKTTTASLVCKQLGFDTVEFNASNTRNKKMIHNEVAQIVKSTSLAGYFTDGSAPTRRHVLLMDEVDGMSGNEDRGGIQELISMIKQSNIPIICMCNDRQHPKIRTLANYCFDLRFTKPRMEQIRGAMMSICFKEGVKVKPDVLTHIIQGTGQDIRQTLNQLSLYTANTNDSKQSIEKDVKLGPWEVIRKVFSEEDHKTMSFIDKSKLFFYDYSIGPLFVQENYLKVVPHCPKSLQLERFAKTADAISMGDVIDSKIRSSQNWSLLDLQSMYASVLPGHYLEGHFGGQIDFPGWLGKNSKANKFKRMLSEINAHTRMSISGDRTAIGLDYVRNLRDAIATPMVQKGADGIAESVEVMRSYNLLREDLNNLIELAHWPRMKDPFDAVESKVKAAFTRAYNKEVSALPYAAPGVGAVKSKRGAGGGNDMEYEDEEEVDDDEANDADDITTDGMIKAKKATSKASTSTSTSKATTTPKGKGKTSKGSKAGPSKRGAKK